MKISLLAAVPLPTAALLALTAAAAAQSPVEIARDYRSRHGARVLREYVELLKLPNASADTAGIRRNAEALRERFARRGASMQLLELPGAAPLVHGVLPAPGATRTLGIYVHYDGQPVQPAAWSSPPWEPTLCTAAREAGGEPRPLPADGELIDPEWRLYARGSSDDKAPFPALLTALDALAEAGVERTSNLVFLFEGEEEIGSPHLEQYMERFGDALRADAWLICDGPVHPSRRPQLVFGVRGVVGLELTVYGAARSLHSGHYGNWAPNPGLRLARLLASMKDAGGRVTIAGFYDDVEPPGEAERAALDALPPVDEALKAELGLAWTEGGGAPLSERLLLPSLNVRGLASAGVGAEAKNVIPSEATASLDIRLVKGCDPEHMLDRIEAHLRKEGYHIVRAEPTPEERRLHPRLVRVTRGRGYPAARTAMDHPIAQALVAAAERAAGEPVIRMPSLGGSLPLYLFDEVLGAPVVITPIANHDNNQHAPDENLRLANLWYGVDLIAAVLTMPPH